MIALKNSRRKLMHADLATDELKKSVKKAGKTVKDEISKTAPKDTGKYQKSWAVKTVNETSNWKSCRKRR